MVVQVFFGFFFLILEDQTKFSFSVLAQDFFVQGFQGCDSMKNWEIMNALYLHCIAIT